MSLPCRKNIPELIHYPRKTNFFYTGDSSRRRNADAGAEGNPQDRRQLSCLSTSRGAAENPPGSFWKGSPGTCTRDGYAVNAIRAGDDIKTVQGNLGHASAAFTLDRYGHFTERMKQDSAARMEGFMKTVLNL